MSVELTPSGTRGQGGMPAGPVGGIFHRLSLLAYRLGMTKRIDGFPVILLTTRGARSGQLRSTPVVAFPQGNEAWLVVGSAGGARKHPAWVVNLAHNPRDVWVEVDGNKRRVTATSLGDREREDAWPRIVDQSGRFGGYQQNTDRKIPVIRLSAAD
jgi:deazaflavin-dependent oxidoreductase (nitroreductase family)